MSATKVFFLFKGKVICLKSAKQQTWLAEKRYVSIISSFGYKLHCTGNKWFSIIDCLHLQVRDRVDKKGWKEAVKPALSINVFVKIHKLTCFALYFLLLQLIWWVNYKCYVKCTYELSCFILLAALYLMLNTIFKQNLFQHPQWITSDMLATATEACMQYTFHLLYHATD